MLESVLPMFSSKSFVVSGLMFRSLIHLSLFLCMVLESVLVSFVVQKLLSLIRSHLFLFAFISFTLGGGS